MEKKFVMFPVRDVLEDKVTYTIYPIDRIKYIEEYVDERCILYFNDVEEHVIIDGSIMSVLEKLNSWYEHNKMREHKMEFSNKKQFDKYMKLHQNANPKNHTIRKQDYDKKTEE